MALLVNILKIETQGDGACAPRGGGWKPPAASEARRPAPDRELEEGGGRAPTALLGDALDRASPLSKQSTGLF